jgi:hypothetical protein
VKQQGETVDSKPGTRVDGYSHQKQEKLVLQVIMGISKYKREWDTGEREAKEGVDLELLNTCTFKYIYVTACYLRIKIIWV